MSQNDFNNNNDSDAAFSNYASTNDNDQPIHRAQPITLQPQALQREYLYSPLPFNGEEFQMSNLHTDEYPGPRRAIPVSTVDWRSTDRSQFIPINGLDFLIGVSALLIQQTVELGDMMSNIESENRYILKVPAGETLYLATELSSPLQRMLCGSRRGCVISLADHTRQEALMLNRRFAMSSFCFPCRLQEMHIMAPPGDYLGRIVQDWTVSSPLYLVKDNNDDLLYVIEGPSMRPCCGKLDVDFKILSGDSMLEQGVISHRWENQAANYVMKVTFPVMAAEPKTKALIIGAAFLLEYTYFIQGKSTKCMSVCC